MLLDALVYAWIGAIIMFTLTVSPTVFQVLETETAGRFLRAYFPRLFRYEMGVGGGVIALTLYQNAVAGGAIGLGLTVGVLVTVLAGLNLFRVMPAVNELADAMAASPTPENKKRFGLLHGLSVGLFGVNAVALLVLSGFN